MKLLRELGLKSMPDRHFGLLDAAVVADIQPYSILRNEARLGRLRIFHPLPELNRITFYDLATWFEDADKIIDQFPRKYPLALRRWPALSQTPPRDFAQLCVQHALRIGLLKREPCLYCGAEKAHAHHPDYRKPLWVIWMCNSHHLKHHGRVAAAGRKPKPAQIELFSAYSYQKLSKT
jgi:hypothetical protein